MNNVKALLTVVVMMLMVGLFLTVGIAQAGGGGNALELTGAGGYVKVSADDNGPLTFLLGSDFTLEAWVSPTPIGTGNRTIFCNGHGGASPLKTNYIFQIKSGVLSLYIGKNWRNSTNPVPNNVWSHVAVVFDDDGDNDSITFYLNGVQGSTIPGSFNPDAPVPSPPNGDFHIGDQNQAAGGNFSGEIDEARVWPTARTQMEILSNMHKTLGAVGAGYWKFDDSLTFDSSPNELPGTSSNATSVPSTAPIASDTVANKTDMRVIWWYDSDEKTSGRLTVNAGTLSDLNYTIFAHNNEGLTPNTDNKPVDIDRRWNRVWTFDVGEAVTADFTFTIPEGQITNKESMVLLESDSDTDFSAATEVVCTPVTDGPLTEMQFTGVSITDVMSYTIGSITSDNPLPVQLSVFTATDTMDGVLISWRTEAESDNIGFNLYRSDTEDGTYTKINTKLIQGAGTDANPNGYLFTDKDVVFGQTYFYYLEDIDIAGAKSKSEAIKAETVDVVLTHRKVFEPMNEFRLMQNYPNPFNPDTWIPYELLTDATVIIRIYDVNGHLVRHLDLGKQKAGIYVYKEQAAYWDGTDQTGQSVSSGLYFYTLEAGDFQAAKRMIIVK